MVKRASQLSCGFESHPRVQKTAWDQDDHMTYSFMSKFLDIQRESYIKINDYLSVLARTTSEMEFDELFEK